MLENLVSGFGYAFQQHSLAALCAGTLIGYFIGAMPGLNPTLGISLLIPFTFGMKPIPAMILLSSLYMACEYGGAITAILINTPGTSAAAATALDGYPLTLQGKAGKALGISIISSGLGSFFSTLLLIAFAIPLARFALSFGGPEYFALALFGLSIVSSLASDSLIKGWSAAIMGLLFSCVGMDTINGVGRYTPHLYLLEGLPFIAVMIGLFAISEVFVLLEGRSGKGENFTGRVDALPTGAEMKSCGITVVRGTLIGFIVGIIPAAGANIASWVSYNDAKRRSRSPELFGNGALEGIAASESANNSAVSGALVPLLTLGIPGSSAAAVLIGALTIQGLQPGPLLFTRNPEIPYSIFAAFLLSAPLMTVFGLTCSKFFARVSSVPDEILAFCIFGVCVLGTYAIGNSMFHVWVSLGFGVLGYFMRKFGFPTAPMVLAIVLGPMAETNLRLALLMGGGNAGIFFSRPISLVIILVSLASFLSPIFKNIVHKKLSSREGQ
ncbi:MAG: tripartite tricarboxylate transporter permease [Synergistaceae bacterium]|jgi:putative tricarboxylic transport membrane protein|nr:tripartite tricarboxylate transporter permease [Synergistaceae bacterium]